MSRHYNNIQRARPLSQNRVKRSNLRFPGLLMVRIVSAVMQSVTLIVIARNVEIEVFGLYSAALSIGAIVLGLLSLGLPTRVLTLTRDKNHLVSATMFVTCLMAVFASVVVCSLGVVIFHGLSWWLVTAAAYIGSEMIGNLTQNILFGSSRLRAAEITIVVRRAIPLISIAISALWGVRHIFEAAFYGFILTAFVSIALVGNFRWTGLHFKAVVGGSVQYWLTSLWSMLQQLDVVIVTGIVGPGAAGAYSAAFRLASPVHIITSSMVSILLPRLSQSDSRKSRFSIGRRFQTFGLVYSALLVLASPLVVVIGPMLYGHQFSQYGWVFSLLLINSAASVFNQLMVARFYAEGRASNVAKMSAASTLVGLFLVIIGCHFLGIYGAAIGTLSIQIILGVSLLISWNLFSRSTYVDGDIYE